MTDLHPRTKARATDSLDTRLRNIGWDVDPDTECWLWRGATTGKGYGILRVNRRTVTAARCAYEAWRYPLLPDEVVVAIVCDNPGCINVDHLAVTDAPPVVRAAEARSRAKQRRRVRQPHYAGAQSYHMRW